MSFKTSFARNVLLGVTISTCVGCQTGKGPSWSPPLSRTPATPTMNAPQTTDGLIEFVQLAAIQVRQRGQEAFADFGVRGTAWNHDDTYLFISDDRTGRLIFHGANPKLVGNQMVELTGAEGRRFGEFTQETLEHSIHAWAFYKWARPSGGEPVWKASYNLRVAGPAGECYIVGSGVYELAVDRKLVTEQVDMAVTWIEDDRNEALTLIRDPKGPFVYRDAQVFVINTKGDVVADPFYPELTKSNQMDLKSADGRPVQRDLVNLIEHESAGWKTGYLWPRPNGGPNGHKDIYMRQVKSGGETLGVGSGLYVD